MIILFSTDWKMAGMKTLFIIFVMMFPVGMITEEDVNHGGNNHDKNLIAHLRIVTILFQYPVSASCTESRLTFSFLQFTKSIIPRIYSP